MMNTIKTYFYNAIVAAGGIALAVFSFIIMRDKKQISDLENQNKEKQIDNIELTTKTNVDAAPLTRTVDEHNNELRSRDNKPE